jgi:hypothetical protein
MSLRQTDERAEMSKEPVWQWWYSQSEESYQGPESSRDAAIEAGRNEFDGEAFMIVEAAIKEPNLEFFDADRVIEQCDEYNEECHNPDGDASLFPETIAPVQKKDLERRLHEALAAWIEENNIRIHSWSFDKTRNEETIPEEPVASVNAGDVDERSDDMKEAGA